MPESAVSVLQSAAVLRRSLVALAALGTAGTAAELALLRHWNGTLELIPWVALGALAVALLAIAIPTAARVRLARTLALLVLFTATIGVFVHVRANYEAGPLDARYTTTWDAMGEPERWLLAATDSVGPSPSLAPMALAFVSLALVFATLHHPALDESA